MTTVAVLNEQQCFIGTEEVEDTTGRIVLDEGCDLPKNGSYKWNGVSFLPTDDSPSLEALPAIDPGYVLYLALRALLKGAPMPREVEQYVAWYEQFEAPDAIQRLRLRRPS